MASLHLTLRITYAWWVMPYLRAVATFAWLTGMEPDCAKLVETMMRGVKFEVVSE
ncbi:hypothetical protein [Metapseudomonas resinovorans]|uniref:hypothetical protein n=1 Tax=Metapseudomonas resinovorans TaxID=53412 RepID=UPI0003FC8A5A|nr:hypothetical protein [Pseudomonas resinovorans]